MASFADVETEEPAFAARVRAAFDAHGHKFLATLRADGSPRISGIETRFLSGAGGAGRADDLLVAAGAGRDHVITHLRSAPFHVELVTRSVDPRASGAAHWRPRTWRT
jgi:hypothetical protein